VVAATARQGDIALADSQSREAETQHRESVWSGPDVAPDADPGRAATLPPSHVPTPLAAHAAGGP
jgi:hypothetical protein